MASIPLRAPSTDNPVIQEYVRNAQEGMKIQFVIETDKGWVVKRANSKKPTALFPTKQGALDMAQEIAKQERTRVFVFNGEGLDDDEEYVYS